LIRSGAAAGNRMATIEKSDLDYLERAFDRLRREAITAAQAARMQAMARGAAKGIGGNTLIAIKDGYATAALACIEKSVRLTCEKTANNIDGAVVACVESDLRRTLRLLEDDFAGFIRTLPWANERARETVGNLYVSAVDDKFTGVMDDLRHGIVGGMRLAKDPFVSVVTSVTNSPGAVVQGGVANVQANVSASGGADALRAALNEFLASQDVQRLSQADKQTLTDVTEVLTLELSTTNPDRTKLARWGKRLLEIAEKLGVSIAAAGIGHVLFGP
jgi:hypothetical protein